MVKARKKKQKPQIISYLVMILLSLIFLYPVWHNFVISISDLNYALEKGFKLWPPVVSFESYKEVFATNRIFYGYYNTVWRAVVGTLLTLTLTYCAAYALRYRNIRGYAVINFLIVFTMYFNGGAVPTYINLRNLGLIDTRWVFVLPGAAGAYNLLVMRSYLNGLGMELEDAARIDGATPFQTMIRVYLPISKPIMAVIGLWSVVGHWNAYYDGMVYAPGEKFLLLQNAIRLLTGEMFDVTGNAASLADTMPRMVRAATLMCVITPILVAYPFVQKYLVKGTMIGAIKG